MPVNGSTGPEMGTFKKMPVGTRNLEDLPIESKLLETNDSEFFLFFEKRDEN